MPPTTGSSNTWASSTTPTEVTVVTSDRGLRGRAHELGATVTGAGSLLARLDELTDST